MKCQFSDFSLAGATQEINSDVIIPDARLPSKGDAGAQSSSGTWATEWIPDEIDPFLKAVMLDATTSETSFALGNTQQYFTFIKEYYQGSAKVYEVFEGVQIGAMSATFDVNSKVKVSFELTGKNNPKTLTATEFAELDYDLSTATGGTGKSYNTLKGAIAITGYNVNDIVRTATFSINQNPEATYSLFQSEATDQSLGNENIDGTFEVWNLQNNKSVALKNDAQDWKDNVSISITVGNTDETQYTITFVATLKTPAESKDGNKLASSIPFSVHSISGMSISKSA